MAPEFKIFLDRHGALRAIKVTDIMELFAKRGVVRPVFDFDRSCIGSRKSSDRAQQRGFAATVGSLDQQRLSRRHGKTQILKQDPLPPLRFERFNDKTGQLASPAKPDRVSVKRRMSPLMEYSLITNNWLSLYGMNDGTLI